MRVESFIMRGLVVSCRRCWNGLGCRVHDWWVWECLLEHCTGTVDPHTLVLVKCYEGVEEMNSWFERAFSTSIILQSVICCCHLVDKQGRESCHWTIMRLIAAASFLAVVSANVNLYHRVFHPSLQNLPYAHRASVSFPSDSNPVIVSSPQLYDSLVSFSEMLETLQNTDGALYQLALEHEGDTSNALWDLSSVKIVTLAIIYFFINTHALFQCHLDKASSETLILHLSNAQDYKPFALDYFVSPIPHDGSCREPHISKKGPTPSISIQSFADKIQHLNSTILLRRPDSPPLYVPQVRPSIEEVYST